MLKSIFYLMAVTVLAVGCGIKAQTYVMTKERVDIEPNSVNADYKTGNAGYIAGTPKYIDPQRKTRKVYILELTKPVAEGEVKKITQETTTTSHVHVNVIEPSVALEAPVKHESNKIVIPAIKDEEETTNNKGIVTKEATAQGPSVDTSYTVMKDDTLQKISKKFYGSYSGWIKIYNANKEKIKNPNLLKSGTVITIPAAK